MKTIKVIYLAGAGRSGGTILGHILGQVHSFFFGGELMQLWSPNLLTEKLCGCGTKLVDCETWKAIFRCAFGGLNKTDVDRFARLYADNTRTRHLPRLFSSRSNPQQLEYIEQLHKLYSAIQQVTSCSVIVDASRSLSYAYLLGLVPSVDLRVIQLVRDSRAVAFSWTRKVTARTAVRTFTPQRHKPTWSAIEWAAQNVLSEIMWKRRQSNYLCLRYEDFALRPRSVIERILLWAGESSTALSFASDHEVDVDPHHSAGGNNYRLQTGRITVKPDNEWQTAMKKSDFAVVSALTWPLLIRYGYPIATN